MKFAITKRELTKTEQLKEEVKNLDDAFEEMRKQRDLLGYRLKKSLDSEIIALRNNEKLRREIEILRQYGNKDCTAMADEEISRLIADS